MSKEFKQYTMPSPKFDAYNQELSIQTALGSDRGRSVKETAGFQSNNFGSASGWRLKPDSAEFNVPIALTVSYTAGEALTAGDAVLLASTYVADLESGSSQYFTRADNATLSLTGDLTIEALVNFESAPSNSLMVIVAKWDENGNNRGYSFGYEDSAGTKRLRFATSSSGANSSAMVKNQTLTTGTWYHVAVVFTASTSTAEFFVNGASIGTAVGAHTAIFDNTASFAIGCEFGAGSAAQEFMDGKIKDVRVWSDVRTGTEVDANWDVSLLGTEGNLVGYWKLDNALTDSTSGGQTLTNNGATVFVEDSTVPVYNTQATSPELWKTDASFASQTTGFLGFVKATTSSGNTATVVIGGSFSGVLSGLTVGQQYYLSDTRGAIALTAGTNSRKVGISLSTTDILVLNSP